MYCNVIKYIFMSKVFGSSLNEVNAMGISPVNVREGVLVWR